MNYDLRTDVDDFFKKCLKIYEMPLIQRELMGVAGRGKIEREFDRNIVIDAYKKRINMIGL